MLLLYSVILTEYVAIETEGVCMSVCACVCVWKLYSQNGCVDLNETLHKWSDIYLLMTYFSIFENSDFMTSWRPFCIFSMGHSHGRNFCPIFFKFEDKGQSCFPQFAIENQQNRSRTFDVITEEKTQNFRQEQNFRTWTQKVSLILIQTRR